LAACRSLLLHWSKELVENPEFTYSHSPVAAPLGTWYRSSCRIIFQGFEKFRSGLSSRLQQSVILSLTAFLLLFIIMLAGQKGLRWMYFPYAEETYQLGLALRDVTQPDDLVITLANDLGDPVGIYYSQRRGWVFPPAEPGQSWGRLMDNDNENIRLRRASEGGAVDWNRQ
jgi:hypothetical protein